MTEDLSLLDLERQLLAAMYRIASVLNSSLEYQDSADKVLQILHDDCRLQCGLLTILDQDQQTLIIKAVHTPTPNMAVEQKRAHYKVGEGIIGEVLRQGSTMVVRNLGSDMRFADKLALYDYEKPFICVPLKDSRTHPIGALAAQPPILDDQYLTLLTKFMEMVANLVAQNVQLAFKVENTQKQLVDERDGLRRQVRNNYSFRNLVGHTKVMRQVFEQIRLVSRWDSTVLIRGESGTGKELVANAIHYNSPRANNPFVKLNCAALPDNLLESELFGHEKGAFTGAVKQRKGRFELADNGTIFLDEIGETSPAFQTKLLRVLQEKEFERVGGTSTISVNVRIVAATNRNLEEEVAKGDFREDLYYRLNVMPMYLPPLRERVQDIPELADHMIKKLSKAQQRKISLTDPAVRVMMGYHWPGNVREMENTLERASVLSEAGVIEPELITFSHMESTPAMHTPSSSYQAMPAQSTPKPATELPSVSKEQKFHDEREMVIDALERTGWVKAKAARLLNMTPRQIAYRIQIMNIEMKQI
ncbi:MULTISPECIES: nif-specific transcriptional activator NifA [Vibrio]|uniref:Nif-specific regulatory protein n=2 Tax=Vibrio TaxID=662 RepID=A0A7X4RWX1_9VIBR|nr:MULTISPECIES: nif-specific transcriptional activator NifA [Vibrio]MBF9002985.1 nif-specific transcriptional activator NifA [Vibrio nitrifigilis]MZI95830.1 nif-specific transcriptional activator NifA [Vibrio eleionomae]